MSSGLPAALGHTAKAGESSSALAALAECRRQREQQDQLLLKAQEELQKVGPLGPWSTREVIDAEQFSTVAKMFNTELRMSGNWQSNAERCHFYA
eukprot:Skav215705  [mRNA]  locus=scaffold2573:74432:75446:+ [translate_table: standard]